MRMNEWSTWAASYSCPILLDGGQATEYERRGADLSRGALWSARLIADSPSLVREVARAYLLSGADIVSTATYQATVEGIARNFLASTEDATEIFQNGVRLVCDERDKFWAEHKNNSRRKPIVAGSIGSYGACMADGSEYSGHYDHTIGEFEDFHLPRALLATQAAADLLAFETIPNDTEAQAIVRMMTNHHELSTIPYYISLFCSDEQKLGCGADIGDTLAALLRQNCHSKNLVALGVNCVSPRLGHRLVPIFRAKIRSTLESLDIGYGWIVRVVLYPNSGEAWTREKGWYQGSCKITMSDWTQLVYAAKPDIAGGCCQTTPEHIRNLRQLL